jgi:hypothetical protein
MTETSYQPRLGVVLDVNSTGVCAQPPLIVGGICPPGQQVCQQNGWQDNSWNASWQNNNWQDNGWQDDGWNRNNSWNRNVTVGYRPSRPQANCPPVRPTRSNYVNRGEGRANCPPQPPRCPPNGYHTGGVTNYVNRGEGAVRPPRCPPSVSNYVNRGEGRAPNCRPQPPRRR